MLDQAHNFELGTRVPLLMRAPFKTASTGAHATAPVEIVDLYRTLAELAGLPEPEATVQGKSLAPVFEDPAALSGAPAVAYSQYDRCAKHPEATDWTRFHGACKHFERTQLSYMGYSMRTQAWRYTVWMSWDGSAQRGKWEDCESTPVGSDLDQEPFCARELYAHPVD